MTISDKTIPPNLAMKVVVSSLTLFIPMVVAMKYLSSFIYGAAATKGVIAQTIVMMMPAMMIGMGMLALRLQSMSWGKLLLHTILMSLGISCITAAVGTQVFLHP
jgi:peptidoglycan/LPS O-acetylase OafA/YrhL